MIDQKKDIRKGDTWICDLCEAKQNNRDHMNRRLGYGVVCGFCLPHIDGLFGQGVKLMDFVIATAPDEALTKKAMKVRSECRQRIFKKDRG